MPETKYKLSYFNLRGRAEPIRLLLHCANIPFEDYRFEISDWPKIKPTIPGGRAPVLQVTHPDGKVEHYEESLAIARLFARKHHMMGETDEDYYRIERMIGECEDIYREIYLVFRAEPNDKAAKIKAFEEGLAQSLFKLLTSSLEAGGGKHVTGNRITLADLVLFTTLDQVEEVMPGYLGKHYPKLHEFHTSLPGACPRLASYLKSRPKVIF